MPDGMVEMQQDGGSPAWPVWDPEADDTLVCRAVRDETHDVKTFVFSAPKPCLFRFKPGQFITLELHIDGTTVNRCYTVSSSAARPFRLSITVKRVPGGVVSNWLHDKLRPGDRLRATGPLGEFTPADRPAPGKYLLLSGGSGITPLMSMTRTFDDLGDDHDVVFVHAARTPADIIFRKELAALAGRGRRVRVVHVCEGMAGEPDWTGFTGRISLPMLHMMAPDFMEREVFVCGPSPFMAAVRGFLRDGGFDMARYHQESFNFEELSAETRAGTAKTPSPPEPGTGAVARFRVEFAKLGRAIECPADTSILDAALAADIRLPFSCSQGICGTCKSRLVSGTVVMPQTGGIRKREIDQGLVLLCCGKPTSDVVIDR
jgi:glycine betaine catabolism B